jgi:hypothetical protein
VAGRLIDFLLPTRVVEGSAILPPGLQ